MQLIGEFKNLDKARLVALITAAENGHDEITAGHYEINKDGIEEWVETERYENLQKMLPLLRLQKEVIKFKGA